MNCIRCAKETEENQVFCNECLKDMERHPVKPGTPIQLPNRENRYTTKRATFRLASRKWEDKIYRLKYLIIWLILIIVLLLAALIFSICVMLHITPDWLNEWLGLPELRDAIQSYLN